MPAIDKSIFIEAPASLIWECVMDPEKVLRWSLIESFEFASGESGMGAEFHIVEVVGSRTHEYDCTVTGWEPEREFGFKGSSKDATVIGTYLIRPEGSGCRFTIVEEITLRGGIIGKIIGRLAVQKRLEQAIEGNLERLKELAESLRTPGA